MGHKNLQDLLLEDQEPFILKHYISDKRCQLKKQQPQLKKQQLSSSHKPNNFNFPNRNLCKNVCFLSFQISPDLKKSPLFELKSPGKSPGKNGSNSIFLHIPARTAALLVEAASRIQKQSNLSKRRKPQIRNSAFGLFGSILKRLKHWNRTQKPKIAEKKEKIVGFEQKSAFAISASSCSWNEEEECLEEAASCEKQFCKSPFRFVLHQSSDSNYRTPGLLSPATSPSRHDNEDKYYEGESIQNFQAEEDIQEEEKEQFSPVSVLDPPFEDDEHENGDDDDDDNVDFDHECSYAFVQRSKQQLMHKLRRFEQLADLKPIELEKRLQEEKQEEEGNYQVNKPTLFDKSKNGNECTINEIIAKSNLRHVSTDTKRLISDLISEEETEDNIFYDREAVVKNVCTRLEPSKEVTSFTIDMMVEFDFKREVNGWKRSDQEQLGAVTIEIEVAIFESLVEELSEELACDY